MIASIEELTAQHRCDRCGSQAYVRVILDSGKDLLFCGHHWKDNEESLSKLQGIQIHNELGRLTDKA